MIGLPSGVAYLGFPAPGDVNLGAPTQPVRGTGSIDAKNDLGVKGRQNLTGGIAYTVVVSSPSENSKRL